MTGFSDYTSKAFLNWTTGQLAVPALPSVWLALFTTAPTSDAGTGGTEVSGTGYARIQVAGPLTASSAATTVITFASVPAWIVPGMSVVDVTTPANIPANTTVVSTTATTVTCSNTVSGVDTNVCQFSAFLPASGSAPSTAVNTSAVITFAQAGAGGWGTVTAVGLYDAVTSGNLLNWDYLGNFPWLPVYVTAASPGVIDAKGHGYANGDPFVWTNEYGGTVPTFSAGTYVATVSTVAGVSGDTFNVTGVNTSSTGSGMVRKIVQQSIPANVTASFAAGTFTVSLA